MSINSKMTTLADEIRELSGTTGTMGLDDMASTLNTENTNFKSNLTTQDNLISQIQTALQNKASGSKPVLQTKTVTPSTSVQSVTPDSGYDGLSTVIVDAIPNTYVKPTATKDTSTYTPTTSNQIIAAGTYCSGSQTIKGDANLVAENIAEGVSIFGVTGTHSGDSGDDGGSNIVSVRVVNTSTSEITYWDADRVQQSIPAYNTRTVSALNGVLYYRQEVMTNCTGNYIRGMISGIVIVVFLSDDGIMNCAGGDIT